jgi:hypothetical protein
MYLQEISPTPLICPCTVVSVSYNTFVSLEPFYHQICSSDLISYHWIEYWMFIEQYYQLFAGSQYQASIGNKFSLLSIFCVSARQTVDNGLQLFLSNQYVSSIVTCVTTIFSHSHVTVTSHLVTVTSHLVTVTVTVTVTKIFPKLVTVTVTEML